MTDEHPHPSDDGGAEPQHRDTLGCHVRAGHLPRKFTARPRIAYIAADSMPPATPSRPEE